MLMMATSADKVQSRLFSNASVCSSNDDNFTVNPSLTSVHRSVNISPEIQAAFNNCIVSILKAYYITLQRVI